MKPRSARNKGNRAQKEVVQMLLDTFKNQTDEDIRPVASAVPGEDIILTRKAKQYIPFSIEVKCQESLSIWAALIQACSRGLPGLLFFRRNRTDWYVSMRAVEFLKLLRGNTIGNDEKS